MRKSSLAFIVCLLLITTACTPLEKQAYNMIVGAKAFLDSERKQHPECSADNTVKICGLIKQAVAAKDTLIDAAEVYCSGPQFETGGVCQAPAKGTPARQQAEAKLKAAIASYNLVSKDLKGAL